MFTNDFLRDVLFGAIIGLGLAFIYSRNKKNKK